LYTAYASAVIDTESGPVRGFESARGSRGFLNIPFATPPVGENRWHAPKRIDQRWTEPRAADTWGNICPQMAEAGSRVVGDEDCLQLNIWSPQGANAAPVIVWIHGGGHVQGGAPFEQAGTRIYDGDALSAKTGSVVVSINYRLGPLGYLALQDFTDTETGSSSGNLGTLDQIAALQWVQRNIAAFGGDPARVMIAGESAGGVSVCMLLASPKASGLFHAAAIQSGGCPARTMRAAEAFSAEFVEAAGCASAGEDRKSCLLSKTAEELLNTVPTGFNIATESGNYGSVIDGVVLTAAPVETIQRGEHNRVPVIIGHNADETSRSVPPIPSEAEYLALLRRTFPTPGVAELVARMYPPSEYGSARAAFVAVTSDTRFICPITRVVEAMRNGQTQPVYRYHFQFVPENANALLRQLGTWHGLDVLYLFESLEGIAGYRPGPADRGVANVFSHFWSTLAAGQDLAGSGGWNPSNSADAYYSIAAVSLMQEGVRTRQCEFWFNLLSQLPSSAAVSSPKLN